MRAAPSPPGRRRNNLAWTTPHDSVPPALRAGTSQRDVHTSKCKRRSRIVTEAGA